MSNESKLCIHRSFKFSNNTSDEDMDKFMNTYFYSVDVLDSYLEMPFTMKLKLIKENIKNYLPYWLTKLLKF